MKPLLHPVHQRLELAMIVAVFGLMILVAFRQANMAGLLIVIGADVWRLYLSRELKRQCRKCAPEYLLKGATKIEPPANDED